VLVRDALPQREVHLLVTNGWSIRDFHHALAVGRTRG